MPERDIEEGLIQQDREQERDLYLGYERASLFICFGLFAVFGLLIWGIVYIGDMFTKKIWM